MKKVILPLLLMGCLLAACADKSAVADYAVVVYFNSGVYYTVCSNFNIISNIKHIRYFLLFFRNFVAR